MGAKPPSQDGTVMTRREVCDRSRPLRVFVTPSERGRIQHLAAQTGLSVSGYLRQVGLGYQPQSLFDPQAIRTLVALHTEQRRLADLLRGLPGGEVQPLLQQLALSQDALQQLVCEHGLRRP